MKVDLLTGTRLDYWVAQAYQIRCVGSEDLFVALGPRGDLGFATGEGWLGQSFPPLAERDIILKLIELNAMHVFPHEGGWRAKYEEHVGDAQTLGEAVLRVLVRARFGDTVPDTMVFDEIKEAPKPSTPA